MSPSPSLHLHFVTAARKITSTWCKTFFFFFFFCSQDFFPWNVGVFINFVFSFQIMVPKNLLSNKPGATSHMFWQRTTLNDEPKVNKGNNYFNLAMCPLSRSMQCTVLPFPPLKCSTRWLQYELRLMRSLTLMKKQPISPPPSHSNCHNQVPSGKTISHSGSKHFTFFILHNWGLKQWLKLPAIFKVLRWPIKVEGKLGEAKLAPHGVVTPPAVIDCVAADGATEVPAVGETLPAGNRFLKMRARKQMRWEIDPVRAVDAAAV